MRVDLKNPDKMASTFGRITREALYGGTLQCPSGREAERWLNNERKKNSSRHPWWKI